MREALIAKLTLLLRPVSDLPDALRSVVWSFRGAPAITKDEEHRLLERLRDVDKGLGARPTPENFYRELEILDAKAAASSRSTPSASQSWSSCRHSTILSPSEWRRSPH
jgi:hypothetical protein